AYARSVRAGTCGPCGRARAIHIDGTKAAVGAVFSAERPGSPAAHRNEGRVRTAATARSACRPCRPGESAARVSGAGVRLRGAWRSAHYGLVLAAPGPHRRLLVAGAGPEAAPRRSGRRGRARTGR